MGALGIEDGIDMEGVVGCCDAGQGGVDGHAILLVDDFTTASGEFEAEDVARANRAKAAADGDAALEDGDVGVVAVDVEGEVDAAEQVIRVAVGPADGVALVGVGNLEGEEGIAEVEEAGGGGTGVVRAGECGLRKGVVGADGGSGDRDPIDGAPVFCFVEWPTITGELPLLAGESRAGVSSRIGIVWAPVTVETPASRRLPVSSVTLMQ